MAEGFANHYGKDVLVANSSGVSPVKKVIPETVAIMNEVNVDISGHVPKWYEAAKVDEYDLVVNMSGFKLPGKAPRQLLEWTVMDPYGRPPEVYRQVRADLENRVMQLILKLRSGRRQS